MPKRFFQVVHDGLLLGQFVGLGSIHGFHHRLISLSVVSTVESRQGAWGYTATVKRGRSGGA
jgi:hypothetical protein